MSATAVNQPKPNESRTNCCRLYLKSILLITIPLVLLPIPFIFRDCGKWEEEDQGWIAPSAVSKTDGKLGTPSRCAYVVLLMFLYWITGCLPFAVTALIPVVLFPLLIITKSTEICFEYFVESNMLSLGALIMAISIEYCELNRRIALRILMFIGTGSMRILLFFMLGTMFLSNWISNIASIAIVLPIVKGTLKELDIIPKFGPIPKAGKKFGTVKSAKPVTAPVEAPVKEEVKNENDAERGSTTEKTNTFSDIVDRIKSDSTDVANEEGQDAEGEDYEIEKYTSQYRQNYVAMIFLGVAYASDLGGCGFINSSITNYKGIDLLNEALGPRLVNYSSRVPEYADIHYGNWLYFNFPLMIWNMALTYFFLHWYFMRNAGKIASESMYEMNMNSDKTEFRMRYNDLGPIRFNTIMVIIIVVTAILLWFFYQPRFMDGWETWFTKVANTNEIKYFIGDSTVAIASVLLLFFLPSSYGAILVLLHVRPGPSEVSPPLLPWRIAQKRTPWSVPLIIGGGYAIAKACKDSHFLQIFYKHVGEQVRNADKPFYILLILMVLMFFMSELFVNGALVKFFHPVIWRVIDETNYTPAYFIVPITVCMSFAFTMPLTTPSNVVMFGVANMRKRTMFATGLIVKIMCTLSVLLFTNSFGYLIYNYDYNPKWSLTRPANMSTAPNDQVNLTYQHIEKILMKY